MNHQDNFYFIYVITFIKSKSLSSHSQNDNNWIEKPASWKWMWSTARCCQAGGINVWFRWWLWWWGWWWFTWLESIWTASFWMVVAPPLSPSLRPSSTPWGWTLIMLISDVHFLSTVVDFFGLICVWFFIASEPSHHKDHHHIHFTCAVSSSNSRRSLL